MFIRGLALVGLASLGEVALRSARGAAVGFVAGIGGGLAMNEVHTIWSFVEKQLQKRDGRGQANVLSSSSSSDNEPATVKVAERLFGPLTPRSKATAGSLVHYAMAGFSGAVYGAVREIFPQAAPWRGLAYGAIVFLLADEIVVPAFGLARWHHPLRVHMRALLAHLAYGGAIDLEYRGAFAIRRRLPAFGERL